MTAYLFGVWRRWSAGIWLPTLLGAALYWAALPPLDWGFLAWLAPVSWVVLIRHETLPGRRPYLVLTLTGFLFWLAALHWLRLPHPATSIGWVALSFYFAFYLPAFVVLARTAVWRLKLSVILAAPVVWTGLELLRGHLLTGMTMGALGHTQYRFLSLIQISDLAGAYGVSFVVMFAAAALGRMLPAGGERWCFWPLWSLVGVLAIVLLYGHGRLTHSLRELGPTVALIQGSIDIQMRYDPHMQDRIYEEYVKLSREAKKISSTIDLIVWPETMHPQPLITFEQNAKRPPEFQGKEAEFHRWLRESADTCRAELSRLAQALNSALLLGIDRYYFAAEGFRAYNSAAYISREGRLLDYYDKMHLVMFGEYVPLASWVPWLQRFTPLPLSITPGERPQAFTLSCRDGKTYRISPNICYETVLPHVIRRQVNQLKAGGREPDILVNLTNDGWFWGSSELDMHLICGVFRAVECRKPLLIAANTGFSAWIDSNGKIVQQGPRRAEDVIIARPQLDRRKSWYLAYGDWPAGVCLAACVVFALAGLWRPRNFRNRSLP